ncbi:MAG: hypothetical protein WC337_02855 [Candidatus Muiribacteriota bacterium]
MKTQFEKRLIGTDEVNFIAETEKFEFAIKEINAIAQSWQEYFGMKLNPEKAHEILTARNVAFTIKSHYVLTRKNERAKAALAGEYKLSQLISETIFPDYESLEDSIVSLRMIMQQKGFMQTFLKSIQRIHQNGKYIFPDELWQEIKNKNTFYTQDIYENVVLDKVEQLCEIFNSINEIGGNILPRDLPIFFNGYFIAEAGKKTFGELKSDYGEARHRTLLLKPDPRMFEYDNTGFIDLIRANYKFQEVEDEIKQ